MLHWLKKFARVKRYGYTQCPTPVEPHLSLNHCTTEQYSGMVARQWGNGHHWQDEVETTFIIILEQSQCV